jgi:pre-mRNA-splicing factor 38A
MSILHAIHPSNRTRPGARQLHGGDPQHILPTIVRERVYDCAYWKERCFGVNAESLVERAVELSFVGGTSGAAARPTPFLCLVLKMLQLQPQRDVVVDVSDQRGQTWPDVATGAPSCVHGSLP